MNVSYSVEESPLGTAGSVRQAVAGGDEPVLVISGDALCDIDLTSLLDFHRERKAAVTIALKSVENPLEFGIVVTDSDGPHRTFPREAVVGPGLLRHDQHGDLRDRARSAATRARRRAVRLLQTALPAAAGDGPAAVRLRRRRLLAGRRRPRAVRTGELRCARRPRAARDPGLPPARERLAELERRGGRPGRDRWTGIRRQLLPHPSRRDRRPVLRAVRERDAARACSHGPLGDRFADPHRAQHADRGRNRRALVRHPLACPHPRGRGDRRRGDDRRPEHGLPERPHLPAQGNRVRRADPREPDLGVESSLAPVREGRRLRVSSRST